MKSMHYNKAYYGINFALLKTIKKNKDQEMGVSMKLTRREILEELERMGIRTISALKKACREFEAYWDSVQS